MTDMTYEELRCALEVATENRRVLAQAVLDERKAYLDDEVSQENWEKKKQRMISLAKEMVK